MSDLLRAGKTSVNSVFGVAALVYFLLCSLMCSNKRVYRKGIVVLLLIVLYLDKVNAREESRTSLI